MTLLPGGVGAGFAHPVLVMGVVIMVASGEGILDGAGEAEEVEPQPAASSAQSATEIYHKFVPTLDMLCITCPLLFHFPPVVEGHDLMQPAQHTDKLRSSLAQAGCKERIAEPFVQCVGLP